MSQLVGNHYLKIDSSPFRINLLPIMSDVTGVLSAVLLLLLFLFGVLLSFIAGCLVGRWHVLTSPGTQNPEGTHGQSLDPAGSTASPRTNIRADPQGEYGIPGARVGHTGGEVMLTYYSIEDGSNVKVHKRRNCSIIKKRTDITCHMHRMCKLCCFSKDD
jgi:hypothetical protein